MEQPPIATINANESAIQFPEPPIAPLTPPVTAVQTDAPPLKQAGETTQTQATIIPETEAVALDLQALASQANDSHQTDSQQRSSLIVHNTINTPMRQHPPKPVPVASVSIPITETIVPLATENKVLTPPIEMHGRRATLEIEGSLFKENESTWSVIWLLYTFIYWTALTWIPILVTFDFADNIWGLIVWCFGFMGMVASAYTIYIGHYPSGSTRQNACAIDGIGRWPAAILTTTVIIDCCVLVYVAVDLEDVDAADNIIYNTQLTRLVLHIVHILWASLFFYNRFYYNHRSMAIRAFILEWGDIIWSTIVSFMISEPFVLDKIYFVIVGFALIGWLAPMMFWKRWGTRRYAQEVAAHLLMLDILTDGPVIVALLVTQSYKSNVILWIDLIWKSCLLQRSISVSGVKQYFNKANAKAEEITESNETCGISMEAITFVWIFAVGLYWNICVLFRCILDNEIGQNYEYYTWFAGMIGLYCVYDACIEGHSAETLHGKIFIAGTCLMISIDSILHAYELLAGWDDDDVVGEVMMFCNCIALISSIVFYSHSFKKGIRYSFILQWIDIILMFTVIEILNSSLTGDCFSKAICIGYFVVFAIKIIFWFAPIVLGYVTNDKHIHAHMVLLDTFTDLPLVLIIILSGGYKINAFVFVDVAFKVIVLLISYSYHLVVSLLLAQCLHNDEE